jgi:hypothetical protein
VEKRLSEYDNSEAKFKLMQAFGEWDDSFDDEQPSCKDVMSGEVKSPPALKGGYATFGVFQLVGHGKQTNERCGTFRKFVGCSRAELHSKVVFDKDGGLVDCRGKGYFKPVFHSCDKPSCPVCYERGWAVREAKSIEFRLEQASKKFGLVEHIIVSFPKKYWYSDKADIGLKLRKLCYKALKSRGVIGGVLIFHGFRYNNWYEAMRKNERVGWYWSPHFHVLGFILGGYGKCRGCYKRTGKPCRKGCGGFVDRNFRQNEVDGIYVKVKGKRKSVFGTAWYQLHHSSYRVDTKRHHVVYWFGVCSYRELKISKELRKEWDDLHKTKCPICGSDLVRHEYCGRKVDVIALFRKRRGTRESIKGFFDKASDWREIVKNYSGN